MDGHDRAACGGHQRPPLYVRADPGMFFILVSYRAFPSSRQFVTSAIAPYVVGLGKFVITLSVPHHSGLCHKDMNLLLT